MGGPQHVVNLLLTLWEDKLFGTSKYTLEYYLYFTEVNVSLEGNVQPALSDKKRKWINDIFHADATHLLQKVATFAVARHKAARLY